MRDGSIPSGALTHIISMEIAKGQLSDVSESRQVALHLCSPKILRETRRIKKTEKGNWHHLYYTVTS